MFALSPRTLPSSTEVLESQQALEGALGAPNLPLGLPGCAVLLGHPSGRNAPGVPPAGSAVFCALPALIPACATPDVAPANGTEEKEPD